MKLGMGNVAERIAYNDYRRRLDARAVLDHYGAENCHDETNKDGTVEVIHSCLLDRVEPHHSHGDSSPSAACNLDKKTYICYSYWGGSLFKLIEKLEGKEGLDQIGPVIGQLLGDATDDFESWKATLDKLHAEAFARAIEAEITTYADQILRPWAFIHPYLDERGIDHATASRLQIGWDERVNRITIPHFWEGKLVGWQARAIPEREGQWPGTFPPQPKYKSNIGFPKSNTLYNYDSVAGSPEVIVVESPFSVIKAESLGVKGVVATFGAKVSQAQIDLLKGFKRVYVWMDNDSKSPAGRLAERRIVNLLHRHTRVSVVVPEVDRDLGDCCSVEEVGTKLDHAEPAVLAMVRYQREGRR